MYQMKTKIYFIVAFVLLCLSCNEDTLGINVTGELTGTVLRDDTEEPLENVKISTNPASSTVFTDVEGNFTLENILVDDYAVQAELDGFSTSFESVSITEGNTSSVAFKLEVSSTENTQPTKPLLVLPEDGQEDLGSSVEFRWESMDTDDDEIIYTLELRSGNNSDIRNVEVVADTLVTIENLLLSQTYFWQVSADDGNNDEVTSNISSFKTLNSPGNSVYFVKKVGSNNVIFSGDINLDSDSSEETIDFNLFQVTSDAVNSFRPKKNDNARKLAFLRTVGGLTHLFISDLSGANEFQVTTTTSVAGFRQDELNYTWSEDGSKLFFANFDKLYSINIDGTGAGEDPIFTTTDGAFISEIASADFQPNILLLKTNNTQGYDVNLFTYNLNTQTVIDVILSDPMGAVGSIDISANGDRILYSYDTNGDENNQYRIFASRLFEYNAVTNTTEMVDAEAAPGFNDVYGSYTPNEAGIIFTRVSNDADAIPAIYLLQSTSMTNRTDIIFNGGIHPDFE